MSERDVGFSSAGQRLEGTLDLPPGASPTSSVPAALLLTGSGPVDRDSNHRRLRLGVTAQFAVALREAGVGSYRFDKRGVGASPGDWRAAGLNDNIADAAAAFDLLKGQPEVGKVFVVGHSEGAVQAAALTATRNDVAGLVLLAGSASTGEETLRYQAKVLSSSMPTPVRMLLRLMRTDLETRAAINRAKLKATTTDVTRLGLVRYNAKWFREFLAYDPSTDLAHYTGPVLAITGAKDLQVDPADLERIRARSAGEVETRLVPDLTHTLRRQPGTANLRSYGKEVRQPVDSEVLATVADWINRHS